MEFHVNEDNNFQSFPIQVGDFVFYKKSFSLGMFVEKIKGDKATLFYRSPCLLEKYHIAVKLSDIVPVQARDMQVKNGFRLNHVMPKPCNLLAKTDKELNLRGHEFFNQFLLILRSN